MWGQAMDCVESGKGGFYRFCGLAAGTYGTVGVRSAKGKHLKASDQLEGGRRYSVPEMLKQ